MVRYLVSALILLSVALPRGAYAEIGEPVPSAADVAAVISALRPDALARGVSPATFDAAFAGVSPDPAVAAVTARQPELLKPVGRYLAAQLTSSRIVAGRALLARYRRDLVRVERRYGVPAAIIVAIWGLETNFGASPGNKDVIRSMVTLAAMNHRPDLYRTELLAALDLLQSGAAKRDQLQGSWAGAMGQPQFMPSSFAKYAVDWDRDGRRDIWTDVPDVLASIANFLASQGWEAGRPWGFEVRLPPGLDLGEARASFAEWAARGVTRQDGAALPQTGDATLYFPAGSSGPAFLVTANFEVIKVYNFSDSYVLGVGELADRMQGGPAISAAWPDDPPITREDRIALQARLSALGYAVDNHDGRISLALRDSIRSAQRTVGLVPDGNPTAALLHALPVR